MSHCKYGTPSIYITNFYRFIGEQEDFEREKRRPQEELISCKAELDDFHDKVQEMEKRNKCLKYSICAIVTVSIILVCVSSVLVHFLKPDPNCVSRCQFNQNL